MEFKCRLQIKTLCYNTAYAYIIVISIYRVYKQSRKEDHMNRKLHHRVRISWIRFRDSARMVGQEPLFTANWPFNLVVLGYGWAWLRGCNWTSHIFFRFRCRGLRLMTWISKWHTLSPGSITATYSGGHRWANVRLTIVEVNLSC